MASFSLYQNSNYDDWYVLVSEDSSQNPHDLSDLDTWDLPSETTLEQFWGHIWRENYRIIDRHTFYPALEYVEFRLVPGASIRSIIEETDDLERRYR